MGTLMGHILPGTFFAIFAIWWGFCIAIRHFHSRHSANKSRKPVQYHTATTFPCLCCPLPSLRTIPLESYLKLFFIGIGILGEVVTGFRHDYDETLKRRKFSIIESNTQHITMFGSFGLAAFIEILVHAKYALPKEIEYIANIMAFGVEGFLFHFHLHGRDDVDVHVHTLLVYSISFCILLAVWEFNRPNQILASYLRAAAVLLQGVWFYAAGFILYFPSKDPYWIWQSGHGSIMTITVMFIWMAIGCCVFVWIQAAIVWFYLQRRYKNFERYSPLADYGNENENETINDRLRMNLVQSNNDQDFDSDSQTEFDRHQTSTSKI